MPQLIRCSLAGCLRQLPHVRSLLWCHAVESGRLTHSGGEVLASVYVIDVASLNLRIYLSTYGFRKENRAKASSSLLLAESEAVHDTHSDNAEGMIAVFTTVWCGCVQYGLFHGDPHPGLLPLLCLLALRCLLCAFSSMLMFA